MRHVMRCQSCSVYTLKETCSNCSSKTIIPRPARYSPEDNYAAYRRKAKEGQLKGKGWL